MRKNSIVFIMLLATSLVVCGSSSGSDSQNNAGTAIEGLIACYSFDEVYGNRALDATEYGHHGLITAASRVEGKIGNGLLFGFDNARVSIWDFVYFDNGLITIEAWIKPYEMENGEVYRIIGDYNYGGFYFQISDGRLEILYEGQSYHYGTATIQSDVWTHIAFTSDGADIVTYINGIEDGRTNITLPVQYIANTNIGAHRIYSDDYVEEFPGIIDEMRIWDGVRTIACDGDFNGDKDVDGSDLVEYLFDSSGLVLEVFATNFGRADCP